MIKQRGNVVAHSLKRQRPVGVCRAAMALQLDRDYLAAIRQGRERRHHLADCHQAAVQQDQRFTPSVDLVIQLDTIHVDMAGGDGRELRAGGWVCCGLRHGWTLLWGGGWCLVRQSPGALSLVNEILTEYGSNAGE
jgi:hypothetical protein